MRVLVIHPGPGFSVADVFTGWVEALRELGCTVATYNLDDRLTFYDSALQEVGGPDPDGRVPIRKALTREQAMHLATAGLYGACYQFWPDLVLGVSAFYTPPDMLDVLRTRRHKVVLLHTESPYQDDEQLDRASHADLNLLNDPTNLAVFQAVAPAAYMPHAYRPAVHHPGAGDSSLACDLAFVGTGFASRIQFLEQMDLTGLEVLLAGNWQQLTATSPLRAYLAHAPDECVDNETTAAIYRSMVAGLNLYRREANRDDLSAGWAIGPREVEMAACGAFFLREPRGEGDALLGSLPTFTGPDDASDQLRWWLNRPKHRIAAAAAARSAIAPRTFTANAEQLLRLVDRQPVTV